jgi:phenylalanine-4-hydroxylase
MESQEEESYIIEQHKKYKLELEAIHRYLLENDELQRVLYVFRKK